MKLFKTKTTTSYTQYVTLGVCKKCGRKDPEDTFYRYNCCPKCGNSQLIDKNEKELKVVGRWKTVRTVKTFLGMEIWRTVSYAQTWEPLL